MNENDFNSPNIIKAIGEKCLYPNCIVVKSQQDYAQKLEGIIHDLQTQLAAEQATVEELKGQLRNKNHTLFGVSSEKSCYRQTGEEIEENSPTDCDSEPNTTKKKRGAQPGHQGQGRKIPEGLPTIALKHELSDTERVCPKCGKQYRETVMSEVSVEVDVEIRIVKKEHHRSTYAQACGCEDVPVLITAPKPAQIIPKSLYSTAFWALLLVTKYFFQIPLNRQIDQWQMHNLELNPGTLIGGFKRLLELIAPLYDKLVEISKLQSHWHADETSWYIFAETPGKDSFRWWMWVFVSDQVCVYVLDASRSGKVASEHFGSEAEGILNVDRYGAYKRLEGKIKRALCWYHVRRDFLRAADADSSLGTWAKNWIDTIASLEQLNERRISCGKDDFETHHQSLLAHLNNMQDKATVELSDNNLSKRQVTILKSLLRNWKGLTIFVDYPYVPMHNNVAERALRTCAVGRKNYYGHHAQWSGELGAMCMSIFQTASKHGLNAWAYLQYYFDACATVGRVPDDLEPFLPWNIPESAVAKYKLRHKK